MPEGEGEGAGESEGEGEGMALRESQLGQARQGNTVCGRVPTVHATPPAPLALVGRGDVVGRGDGAPMRRCTHVNPGISRYRCVTAASGSAAGLGHTHTLQLPSNTQLEWRCHQFLSLPTHAGAPPSAALPSKSSKLNIHDDPVRCCLCRRI